MIDLLLITLGALLLLVGFLGCILPVIPGPSISFLALIVLESTGLIDFDNQLLWTLFFIMVIITVIDYVIPIWFVRKAGASRKAMVGSALGLIIGIFAFPPLGIIIGPFVGAFVGELMQTNDTSKALKGGLAAFAGFVFGSLLKIIFAGYVTWLYFSEIWTSV
jgi:hypothetical protein